MPKTLLLADDSVVIQKLVGLSFVNEDIKIVSVDNGDDAVKRAIDCKPDVILADVVMPGKSGYEVCAAIRNNPDLATTPILLLTGTFEAFDESRARDVGATGHITKPFEAQALVDRVNAILAEQASSKAAVEPAPTATDFFADDLAEAGASPAPAGVLPETKWDQNTVLTPMPLSPESTDEVSATSIPIDPTSGLDDLLSGAGGDHTVAFIADAVPASMPATPVVPRAATSVATEDRARSSVAGAPTSNPDQTTLVDDFFADTAPTPATSARLGSSLSTQPNPTNSSTPDSNPWKKTPSPDPLSDLAATDTSSDAPWSDALDLQVSPPPSRETSSEFADLGLGSDADIPLDHLASANFDETLLADDMFGDDDNYPDMVDLDENFGAGLTDPIGSQYSPSRGLDIDFGAPTSDSMIPTDTSAYDVSTSDLGDSLLDAAPGWSPTPQASKAVKNDSTSASRTSEGTARITSSEPIQLMDEPSPTPPERKAAAVQPEINFAQPMVSPFDETVDAIAAAPSSASPSMSSSAPAASRKATDRKSDSAARPELTPAMHDRIHDTLEKVAWEAFADLSDDIVRQLMQRVEQIAWEVIPQMAETLIKDEIRRMKGEEGEE